MEDNKTLIQIKNYHSIEEAKINIRQGITVIVGATNAGKSSIMRALLDLINNTCSDSDVKIGTDECSIAVKNNGNIVKLIRNPNKAMKTTYVINGEEISKVGRNKVEEAECIGFGYTGDFQLNILKQEDLPFLIYEPANRLYDFLSQSLSNELLEAGEELKNDKKALQKSLTMAEAEVNEIKNRYNEIKEELTKYPNIEKMKNLTDYIKKSKSEIDKFMSIYDDYSSHINRIKEVAEKIENIDKDLDRIKLLNLDNLINISKNLSLIEEIKDDYENNIENIKAINEKIAGIKTVTYDFKYIENIVSKAYKYIYEIDSIANNYKENSGKLEKTENQIKEIPSVEIDLNNISDICLRNNILMNTYEEYEETLEKIQNINYKLPGIVASIEELENEKSKYNVCPTCGRPIDENHKD